MWKNGQNEAEHSMLMLLLTEKCVQFADSGVICPWHHQVSRVCIVCVQITWLVESVQRTRGQTDADSCDRCSYVSHLREDCCSRVWSHASA